MPFEKLLSLELKNLSIYFQNYKLAFQGPGRATEVYLGTILESKGMHVIFQKNGK